MWLVHYWVTGEQRINHKLTSNTDTYLWSVVSLLNSKSPFGMISQSNVIPLNILYTAPCLTDHKNHQSRLSPPLTSQRANGTMAYIALCELRDHALCKMAANLIAISPVALRKLGSTLEPLLCGILWKDYLAICPTTPPTIHVDLLQIQSINKPKVEPCRIPIDILRNIKIQ